MTIKEFLSHIDEKLSPLSSTERERTVAYFDEILRDRMEDGMTEEEAVRSLGDPDGVVADILAEFAGQKAADEENGSVYPERKRYERECDGLSAIQVKDSNTPIKVTPSPDGKIRIHYTDMPRLYYQIEETAGVLRVTKRDERKWYEKMRPVLHFDRNDLLLEIPAASLLSLSLITSNGIITVRLISVGEITAVTDNGGIILADITAQRTVDIKAANGPVKATDSTAGDLFACTNVNGSMVLRNVTAGALRAKTSNAPLKLEGVASAGALTAETANGSLAADNVKAGAALTLHTSNGVVRFSGLAFEEKIEVITSNGTIAGELPGSGKDYSYHCHTSNGKCNLPENMKIGEKAVHMQTSNGSIRVDFEEK